MIDPSKTRRVWVTGPSGSRWSGVSQHFQDHPMADNGDITPDRLMNIRIQVLNRPFHKGAYFDPGNEGGEDWMDLENKTDGEITGEIDRLWGYPQPADQFRVIKSHFATLSIHDIKRRWPDDMVIMVKRERDLCLDWWAVGGGLKCPHPRYGWFYDEEHVEYWIDIIREAHETLVKQFGSRWERFDADFVARYGMPVVPNPNRYNDVEVAVI
jgi:hypothetical protein